MSSGSRGTTSTSTVRRGPISEALWSYKEAHKLSWIGIARRIGIDPATARILAHQKRDITILMLQKLAAFFEWTAQETGEALLFDEHLEDWTPAKRRGTKGKRPAARSTRENVPHRRSGINPAQIELLLQPKGDQGQSGDR